MPGSGSGPAAKTVPDFASVSSSSESVGSSSEGTNDQNSSASSRSSGSSGEGANLEGLHTSIAAAQEQRRVENVARSPSKRPSPDFGLLGQLHVKIGKGSDGKVSPLEHDIRNTPSFSGTIVEAHSHNYVSQYGLLGYLDGQDPSLPASQIYLNTDAPFSTFICGVQGSGKSHTKSCILENALVPSRRLGRLESPASTLVCNYGTWSNGGAGLNISEATFLATASKGHRSHNVRRITVLTSPSNPAINKLYQRHPNVRIMPFRLRACTLDIGILNELMTVDEKAAVPSYMARVQAILRDISTQSKSGSSDYSLFKKRLQREKFDWTQRNMLDMRLNLLESFWI